MAAEQKMKIESLWHYPIKGLSPQRLSDVELMEARGFPYDREYAVTDGSFEFDEANPVPKAKTHFLMLARYERLATLRSHFDVESRQLVVMDAAQRQHEFDLTSDSGKKSLASFLGEVSQAPLQGQGPVVVNAEGHRFTDVSVRSTDFMNSISLINLATVRDLASFMEVELDPLRFRANIYLEGAEPWSELDWVGRTLQVGEVVLRVVSRTRRCAATSVDPESGVRDLNVPAAIHELKRHADCGVYAEVLKGGLMRLNETIRLR